VLWKKKRDRKEGKPLLRVEWLPGKASLRRCDGLVSKDRNFKFYYNQDEGFSAEGGFSSLKSSQ